MKNKVISRSNLPSKIPLFNTLITAIALDYWKAPGWVWGALGVLFTVAWIASIYAICKEKQTDIFKEK